MVRHLFLEQTKTVQVRSLGRGTYFFASSKAAARHSLAGFSGFESR